jgi:transcriptional regulator with GAF, ATPase, and Fis domain
MRMFYTCNKHSWAIICNQKPEKSELLEIERFFSLKSSFSDFPFAFFCDHIPSDEEINTVFTTSENLLNKDRDMILLLRKKSVPDMKECWGLLQKGIDDVVEWGGLQEVFAYLQAKYNRSNAIRDVLFSELVTANLIGRSGVWTKFLSKVIEVSLFSQASVLLIGESGTGKELVSRLIHTLDQRSDKKKLVIVDCTTIVSELSGSELFGHERGSYTSAIQSREGAFALANGGTLFLDEIGELPLPLQAELLRVLQEGTYKKVGSNTWQKTNFRLVCATNKDLRELMLEGKFRADLYYRIADFEYYMPSLKERIDDIPELVAYFLLKLFPGTDCPQTDKLVMDYLVRRDYPGNIRELKQLVQRIALKHTGHRMITIGEVPTNERCFTKEQGEAIVITGLDALIRKSLLTGDDWWKLKDKISETAIKVALDIEKNNKQKAAERLGVDVRTVQQYVKKRK